MKFALVFAVLIEIAGTLTTARAQIPVTDAGSIAQLVQQVQTAGQQLSVLKDAYDTATRTYQQVYQTYAMLTRFANPNGIATELESPFLQNPMTSINGLPNVITGTSSFAGIGSNLGNLATAFSGLNRVYTPAGNDFTATSINQQANSISNLLALATQNLESLRQRTAGLQELQDKLGTASDIQTVSSVNARIATEQSYIQTQSAEATSLQTAAQIQLAAVQAAQEQKQRQDADALYNATQELQ
jgi:type IV secretion system protein VirB5